MSKYFILILVVGITSCSEKYNDFIATKFKEDSSTLELRQVFSEPNGQHFVGIFFKESDYSFGSGHKVMKLYSMDSISIDEVHFGAFTIEIKKWGNLNIYLLTEVYSAHGDSTTRKRYLDNSSNKNKKLGPFKLFYEKNYNKY